MASTPFSSCFDSSSLPVGTNSSCAHNFFLQSDIPIHIQVLQAPEIRSMDHSYHKSHVEPFSGSMNLATEATDHVLLDAPCHPRDISFLASFPHSHSYQSHHSPLPQDEDRYPTAHQHFRHSYQSTTTFQELEATHYLAMLHGTTEPPHSFCSPSAEDREVIKTEAAVLLPELHDCDSHHHYHPHYHGLRRTQSMESFSTIPRLYSENVLARWPTDYDCHRSVSPNSSESTPILSYEEEQQQQQQQQHSHYLSVMSVDGNFPYHAPHYDLPFYPSAAPTTVQDQPRSEVSSPSLSSSYSTSVPSSSTTSISTSYSPALSSASPIFRLKRASVDVVMSETKPSQMMMTTAIPPTSSSSSTTTSSGSSSATTVKKCKPQRYFCTVPNCNRAFSRPYNLKSHGLTHNPLRPYACDLCAKSFSRVHDRDRHLNSHMEEKPHVCIVCQGRFARQDAVIRHLKLSNETNACSWILKSRGIQFRDVASGRITRASLGDEGVIRETLEALEEQARKVRATRTMELVAAGTGAQAAAAAAQAAHANLLSAKVVEETVVKKEEF